MSEDQEARAREVRETRQIIGLLEKSFRIARDASMTGSMQGSKEYVLQQYNAIVASLAERGTILPGYFPPLTPDASFDSVGVACAQLAEYLKGGLPDEREFDRRHERKNVNIIGNVGDLKEIGEIIRQSLPEWMRAAREKREPREPGEEGGARATAWAGAPEPNVAPPSSAQADLSGLRATPSEAPPADLERRLADLAARIQSVAEEMRAPGVTPETLQRLANEALRLGQEQARLADQVAGGRGSGEASDEA